MRQAKPATFLDHSDRNSDAVCSNDKILTSDFHTSLIGSSWSRNSCIIPKTYGSLKNSNENCSQYADKSSDRIPQL